MKILNQTQKGEIGRILVDEEWLTTEELYQLDEIRKSGLEIKE